MYVKETAKSTLEQLTGIGRPSRREAGAHKRKAWPSRFGDDGLVPTILGCPLFTIGAPWTSGALRIPPPYLNGSSRTTVGAEAGATVSTTTYTTILACTKCWGGERQARVRFGGDKGKTVHLKPGDVVILPAGKGHQALSASKDLVVVGAYPPQGKYEEYKGSLSKYERAVRMIPRVALPRNDPIYGRPVAAAMGAQRRGSS